MTTLIVSSLAWAVFGFFGGYAVGRAARDASPSGDPAMTHPHRRRPRIDARAVVGLLILALLALSSVSIYLTIQSDREQLMQTEQRVACQTEFNNTFARALAERNDSAAAERDAQRDLLLTLLGTDDDAESQQALDRYLAALDRADASRMANPLPQRVDCREPR